MKTKKIRVNPPAPLRSILWCNPWILILIAFLATTTLTAQDTLPAPRCEFASAYLDGSWYIFGGLVDTTQSKSVKSGDYPKNDLHEWTDDDDGWKDVDDYNPPSPRNNHKMVAINGKLYTFGGEGTDPDNFLRDTWVYDPATKTWTNLSPTAMGDIPNNVANYGLAVYNNLMYLYGGHQRYFSGGQVWEYISDDLYSYNTEVNHWEWINAGPSPKRQGAVVEVFGDKLYAIGGKDENGDLTNSVWAFSFGNNNWEDLTPTTGPMPPPFSGAGSTIATINQEVQILSLGGVDENNASIAIWGYKVNDGIHMAFDWEGSDGGLKVQGFELASRSKASGDTCTLTVFGGRDTLMDLSNRFIRYVFDTTFCDIYEYDSLNIQWVPQGTAGILQTQIIPEVKVYPNPANDIINIEFESKESKRFTISLFNINGQLVERKIQKGTIVKTRFITRHLNNGVYMITISSGNELLFRNKIMKISEW